jgi:signal transduction histidine kinase
MNNRRHRLGGVVALLALTLFAATMPLTETALIREQERSLYLLCHTLLTITLLPLAFFYWKKPTSVLLNVLVCFEFIFYTLTGQWFRSLYIFSFIQLVCASAFIFQVPTKTFRILIVLWSGVFTLFIYLRWENMQEQFQHMVMSDFLNVIVSTLILGMIAHTYFTSDRVFRELALSRFSRMGFQSARLIHDLKGLTSAPKTYAEIIRKKLGSELDPVLEEALSSLSHDLENLNRVILELCSAGGLMETLSRSEQEIEPAVVGI